jgi:hypothetical protein
MQQAHVALLAAGPASRTPKAAARELALRLGREAVVDEGLCGGACLGWLLVQVAVDERNGKLDLHA